MDQSVQPRSDNKASEDGHRAHCEMLDRQFRDTVPRNLSANRREATNAVTAFGADPTHPTDGGWAVFAREGEGVRQEERMAQVGEGDRPGNRVPARERPFGAGSLHLVEAHRAMCSTRAIGWTAAPARCGCSTAEAAEKVRSSQPGVTSMGSRVDPIDVAMCPGSCF